MSRILAENLIGKKFNFLSVLSESTQKGYERFLECQCDCGKKKNTLIHHILSGHTKSCGCAQINAAKKTRQKQILKNGLLPFGVSASNSYYAKYRCSAKKRSLSFLISFQDFYNMAKLNCFYCGSPPQSKQKANHISKDFIITNGLDRLDSKSGYTIENCVPCCSTCNFMKRNLSKQEFIAQVKKICLNHE